MARKAPRPRGPQLDLAGDLSVAFVNTAGARADNRQQGVESYAELLAWSQQVGIVAPLEAERLRRRAVTAPAEAEAAFARAKKLRSSLARLFLAVWKNRELPDDDLGVIGKATAAGMPAVTLVRGEKGVIWGWEGDGEALERMLWPILLAAAELLISLEGRPQIHQCRAEICALFFVDRSPSGRRKWCEMKTCGNRVKSLRHYHRSGKHNRPKNWIYDRYR